jgi:hypothetical protein
MKAKLKDLKPDPKNANKHSEFGMNLLEQSLRHMGAGRSILISKDNVVIGGNGVYETAGAIGLEDVEIVESDGSKLIAVRRTDVKSGTPEFYNLALSDNVIPKKNIVLDAEVLNAIVEEVPATAHWVDLALDEPKSRQGNIDNADSVKLTFEFGPRQAADVQQALKISRKVFAKKIEKTPNRQSDALYFIIQDFLSKHRNIKTD